MRCAEHPDDRRQRHRLEVNAIRLIGAIAAFSALVLGGALRFALTRSA